MSALTAGARRAHPLARRMTVSAALTGVVLIFIGLALVYSIVNPLFEAPDEYPHFFTALHLAQGHGFAAPDAEEPWFQEAAQPPLYYLLTAALIVPVDTSDARSLLWFNEHRATGFPGSFANKNQIVHTQREAWPYRQTVLAVHLVRGVSILLGAATILLIYAIARLLIPASPRLALAAAALTALTPQFLFTSASVSNDNLINALAALVGWLLLQGLRVGRFRGWPVALGVTLGLAGLAKATGLFLWPLAGLSILLVAWRRGRLRAQWLPILRELVIIFGLALAIAGWWYVRNWLLYRDPTGVKLIVALMQQKPTQGFGGLMAEVRGMRFSYWGLFGWFNVMSPVWLYRIAHYLSVAAGVGLPFALLSARVDSRAAGPLVRPGDLPWLLLPAAWAAIVTVALFQYDRMLPALQGRLLLPAAWGFNLFLVLGWAGVVSVLSGLLRRSGLRGRLMLQPALRLVAAAPLALLAAWAVAAPFAIIAPAYAWPARVTPAEVPAALRRPPVDHGPYMRFLGGAADEDTVRPGEALRTTAYWETLAPIPEDYTAYIHALTPDGQSAAEANAWPGRGGYPTRLWQPGEVVVDQHEVVVPWQAQDVAPTLLKLEAGFFLSETDDLLEAHGADGAPARSYLGQVRLLPLRPPVFTPAVPFEAPFGDAIRLLGYTLTPGKALRAGQPATLTLYWQGSAAIPDDWTVFVHLRPKSGAAQLGWDRPPRDGAWPTSAWEPGYAVEDAHALPLPADAPVGPAELWIGLYRADGSRLPVSAAGRRTQDDALYLQDVELAR